MTMIAAKAEESLGELKNVEKIGNKVSSAIHNVELAGGEPARYVADVLHGKWLGHPLHPVLTDLTIGSWVLGVAFDALGAMTGDRTFRRTGDRLTEIGTISAIPTALTGLTDYSTVHEDAGSPAFLHGVTNTVNFVLYCLSIRDRRRGNRTRALAYSFTAMGLSCFSAWLGGALVYRYKVGVDHRDKFEKSPNWIDVMDASSLQMNQSARVQFQGKPVLLYRDDEGIHAIGATCMHAGGPLDEGEISAGCVTCPWHHSVFDLHNGHAVHGPATAPQPTFSVRIRAGQIQLQVNEP